MHNCPGQAARGGACPFRWVVASRLTASPLAGAVLGTIGGGAEGALVGLIVGVPRSEKWEWVPLEWRHLGVVTPSGGRGRGVGLRLSF